MNAKRNLLLISLLGAALFQLGAIKLSAQAIPNGTFETPVVGATNVSTSYKTNPASSYWTWTGTAGIGANGCKYNPTNPTANGNQYAFLDASSGTAASMYRSSISIPDLTQLYTVYFTATQGPTNTQPQTVTVMFGTNVVGQFTPPTGYWGSYQTPPAYATGSPLTLTFSTPSSGGAVLIDNIPTLGMSVTDASSLVVGGLLDVSGNIDFGTFQGSAGLGGNGPGALLSYIDNNGSNAKIGLVAAGARASYLWQDNGFYPINYVGTNQANNKMLLDGSNNLTLYATNGSVGITLNPNTGRITLASTGSGITLSDGTLIQNASSLQSTALYNGSGTQLLGFGANDNLTATANSVAIGIGATATGTNSAAFGYGTIAAAYDSVALGKYNVGLVNATNGSTTWVPTDPVLEIGNGVSGAPSDALTIFKNGNLRTVGTVEVQGSFRTPPAGDLSMGSYTNGNNPATLNPATGLLYPSGN